ncbi:hypothetical protein ACFFX0_26480 [Citricoccus parietis]|uniref:Uncharacterized protein n=1 Tax=Citricoccus parietis TaxID=592307 RepID=A0ABV5G6G5_9MICC
MRWRPGPWSWSAVPTNYRSASPVVPAPHWTGSAQGGPHAP